MGVEKESKKDVDRKPKYVHNLLKAADERQKEFERRIERQVQREREKEGNEFADKESFVTSAYRKKMEEIAKQEEEEARIAQMEAVLDVTKQNNMDGFYRHLYRQTMGEEKGQMENKLSKGDDDSSDNVNAAKIKEEIKKIKIDDQKSISKSETSDLTIKRIDRKKEFRKKQKESSSESESDSSSDSDNEEENTHERTDSESKLTLMKQSLKEQKEKRETRTNGVKTDIQSEEAVQVVNNVEESTPKIDIWKKRTVEEVFDRAVQRYWERKAAREAGS